MTIREMIHALLADGMTQQSIADKAGTAQPTIHRASRGADVRYETGKSIERLYDEMLAKQQLKVEELGTQRAA